MIVTHWHLCFSGHFPPPGPIARDPLTRIFLYLLISISISTPFPSFDCLYIFSFMPDVFVTDTKKLPKLCHLQLNQFQFHTEFLMVFPLYTKHSLLFRNSTVHFSLSKDYQAYGTIEILENLFGEVPLENINAIAPAFPPYETEQNSIKLNVSITFEKVNSSCASFLFNFHYLHYVVFLLSSSSPTL